jgi:hypothetical protein
MNDEIQNKINEFITFIRRNSPQNAVSFDLFINYNEYDAAWRFFDKLKGTSVSMKNLNGKWIEN